ncbi:hypothetical protein FMUBM48_33940 [Nocardia cyriacigeorgica]|nr:hypothetical protein FMUBM48_33940 [Nocardia cyriacigeorgica]
MEGWAAADGASAVSPATVIAAAASPLRTVERIYPAPLLGGKGFTLLRRQARGYRYVPMPGASVASCRIAAAAHAGIRRNQQASRR